MNFKLITRNFKIRTYTLVPELSLAGILAALQASPGGSLGATLAHFDSECSVTSRPSFAFSGQQLVSLAPQVSARFLLEAGL